MRSTGKVLIIDDDPRFVRLYESRLGEEGYLVETAPDAGAALVKLDQPGWDVVLLDQKLQGREGPDSGLDLLAEVRLRAPSAKTLLVTAYATPGAIMRAFQEGVYDYLQKDEFFQVLLLPKLRNAIEAVRARQLGELTREETEVTLREAWAAVESEADPNRKGKLLEDLMLLLVKTIPGFRQAQARRRNDVEEIDLLIRNESTDPFWVNERTSYILIECKNWTKPAGVNELRSFMWKLERRYGRCRLGLFVAVGGFTSAFRDDLRGERKDDYLVLLLDRDDLRALVLASDRNACLKTFHERAVVELNGH
ncbi:response regulator [Sorangium sp. So ce185]|uniref:response regulator n=1 Tax=Sorangium sp. So ce185 TaxID=3133287 RepID=UPI003F6451D8